VRGLNRVVDARTEGAGTYSLGLFAFLGLSSDARTADLPEGVTEVKNTEYDGAAYMVAGMGLGAAAEIGVRVTYLVNQLNRASEQETLLDGEWEGDNGFSEARLSLKYNINPTADRVWFGIMPWAAISMHNGGTDNYAVNADGWDGIWVGEQAMFEMRRPMISTGSFSYGGNVLVSYDMMPAVLHANVGYQHFEQNFDYTDARYDADHQVVATEDVVVDVADQVLYLAAGLEYPIGSTTLFAEVDWRHFLDREFTDATGKNHNDIIQMAPGVRFNTSGLAVDVTGSFALTTFDPEWADMGHSMFQAGDTPTLEERSEFAPYPNGYAPKMGLGVGISYSGDFREDRATVGGRIYDAESGNNLDGTVSCTRSGVDPVATSGGRYVIELPSGEAGLTAEADGYLPASRTITAAAGGTYAIDFALDRIDGNVIGTVTSQETGEPIQATVSMVGGPRTASAECRSNGMYQLSLPFGERTIRAQATGFLPETRTVDVPARGTITVDFQLRPALVQGQVLTFNNIYFDFDSAVIKAESHPVLDGIVAMFLENENARVQIAGHCDSDGSSEYNQGLSERRAASVFDYLVAHGVPARRLTTVGYGESQPLVPNTSDANKAQNRRIEFTVLGID
jgi:outer membrane protein OmpA-like peptidoglycan-associated protein